MMLKEPSQEDETKVLFIRHGGHFGFFWHDMAMEQSLNRDCGKDRQLCKRHHLTAHLQAAAASAPRLV